jgi:hypothetical protein
MEYEVFIGGETVGLCVPSNDEFVIKQWSSWLAREEITKYLNAVCLFFYNNPYQELCGVPFTAIRKSRRTLDSKRRSM